VTSNNPIPFVDLAADFERDKTEILEEIGEVISSGKYILGPRVLDFEREVNEYLQTNTVSVGNGSDALVICLKLIGVQEGDEVITVSNSFIATSWAIRAVGAIPVFVDIDESLNINPDLIEGAITPRTRAVIPVHLYGNPCNLRKINKISKEYGIAVIEDAAQAIGARFNNSLVGSMGNLATFSLHPLKNLSVIGDGGFITTHDLELAERLKVLRNHGLITRDKVSVWGYNSRLDEVQAAVALIRMKRFQADFVRRKEIADKYQLELGKYFVFPLKMVNAEHAYHRFVLIDAERDCLIAYAKNFGIELAIHYPIPIHKQPIGRDCVISGSLDKTELYANSIVSLPNYPTMTNNQVDRVIECLLRYKGEKISKTGP